MERSRKSWNGAHCAAQGEKFDFVLEPEMNYLEQKTLN
jgi:hypothetical protein